MESPRDEHHSLPDPSLCVAQVTSFTASFAVDGGSVATPRAYVRVDPQCLSVCSRIPVVDKQR